MDIRAEMDGKLAQRVFTFRLPPGATKHVVSKTHWREMGAVREEKGWLGVDPMVNWELGVLGPLE